MATPRIVSFHEGQTAELIRLWNDVFGDRRNAVPMTPTLWQERVVRSDFAPELLRVAVVDDAVMGFAHGGLWDQAWCRALFPNENLTRAVYLGCVAVHPNHRRQGVARSLLQSLRESAGGAPLRADGRMFNPFYGNSRAPVAPLWGTPEGLAVAADDENTVAALTALGFSVQCSATSLACELGAAGPSPRESASEWRIESRKNASPLLGERETEPFLEPNQSRTWLALSPTGEIGGALVAFPWSQQGAAWGIHSLQVDERQQGVGLAQALLERVCGDLLEAKAERVEVLTVPEESPAALHVYEKAGFQRCAEWAIFA